MISSGLSLSVFSALGFDTVGQRMQVNGEVFTREIRTYGNSFCLKQ